VDRTEWFLALIAFLLAVITMETVSDATNGLFRLVGGGVAILTIFGLPPYLLVHATRKRIGD